jgi:hypothetical protein
VFGTTWKQIDNPIRNCTAADFEHQNLAHNPQSTVIQPATLVSNSYCVDFHDAFVKGNFDMGGEGIAIDVAFKSEVRDPLLKLKRENRLPEWLDKKFFAITYLDNYI